MLLIDKYGRCRKIQYMTTERAMLTKKVLYGLLVGGAIAVAATSPYFGLYVSKKIFFPSHKKDTRVSKTQWNNAFYYMKKKGYLNFQKKSGQIYISLTREGRKKAGKYMIDEMHIEKPKKWDRKWRVVVFDIPNVTRLIREALRGKLIEFGFYKLQQSIWIFPYDCEKEVRLLRQFFGLDAAQLQLIVAEKIEDEPKVKKLFKLS